MKLLFTIVLFLNGAILFGQENYDAELIPASLRSRANACIRDEETIVDMRTPDNVNIKVNKVITVFNENGEDEARLVLHYDKNTQIKTVNGEVYNSVGVMINKFTQKDFADVSVADGFSLFIDSRVKHYLPNVNQYPYTIAYHYEIRNKQNLIIPKWMPKPADDISVEKSSFTFISKPTDQVRINTLNYTGDPETITDDKQKKVIWKANSIAAVKTEPFSPDPETYRTSVQIAPQDFTYYNHKGSYKNWEDLGKWIYDDLISTRNTLPPATIAMIRDLVKDEKTNQDKAKKIYQYLQNKTRYISVQIGIGGFQPISASEVDRLGYGDCKALVNYMQSLLKAVDIESYYCVVDAGSDKKNINAKFADMSQGNHIILCLPFKSDTTWLECTSQKVPYGFLGDFTDDRVVFACMPDGGKLLRTPKLTSDVNLQVRKAELNLDANGSVNGTMITVFSGAQYDNHESNIGKTITEQDKALRTFYNVDNINFDSVGYLQEKNKEPKTTENLKLNIRNFASVNGKKMFLQVNAFNSAKTIPELKARTLPVYINRGYTDEDIITYHLPQNVNQDLIQPFNKKYKSEFGTYEASLARSEGTLIYHRKIMINDGLYAADQYANFSKFMNDISAADQLKLVFSLK